MLLYAGSTVKLKYHSSSAFVQLSDRAAPSASCVSSVTLSLIHILCRAHADGVELELPKKAPPKKRKMEDRTVLVLVSDNKAGLHKRPEKGLLAGLYELPNLPGRLNREEVLEFVKKQGLSPLRIQELPTAKHIFSHIEWHMTGYAVKVEEPPAFWENSGTEPEEQDIRKASAREGIFFVEKEQMEEKFSIPAAFGAYTQYFKAVSYTHLDVYKRQAYCVSEKTIVNSMPAFERLMEDYRTNAV